MQNLPDEDKLWRDIGEGYSHQVCFREIGYDLIVGRGEDGRKKAKQWFNGQLPRWGRKRQYVFRRLFETIPDEVNEFRRKIQEILDKYAPLVKTNQ